MILCIDCGNTMIKFALFENGQIVKSFQIRTLRDRTSDEYAYSFSSLIKKDVKVDGAIISSVVPLLTPALTNAIKKAFNVVPRVVGKELKTKMPIKIDNPNELGGDMLIGALAARGKFGNSVLVADLGTATKVYVVNEKGAFIGGAITCGIEVSLRGLVNSTSQLLETPMVVPNKIIGKSTKDSIESGIVYGQAFMVKEFAKEMEEECGYKLTKVLTGGFSKIIKDILNDFIYDEDLCLEGLYEIYKMNEVMKNE